MLFRGSYLKKETRGCIGGFLAIVAMSLYVSSEIALRYSTLPVSYPVLLKLGILDLCECAVLAMCVVSIILRVRFSSLRQSAFIAIAFCALLFSAQQAGDNRFVCGLVVLLAVSGIKKEELFSAYYKVVLLTIAALMLCALVGVLANNDVIPNSRLVFAYGFAHPNGLGALLYSAIGAMSLSHWNDKGWKMALVLALASACFSYVMLSSHAAGIVLLLLSIVLAVGHMPRLQVLKRVSTGVFRAVLIAVPLALLLFMLYNAASYDDANAFQSWVNEALHYRPYFAHSYYEQQGGFTLMGRGYVNLGHYHNGLPFAGVDSGYCFVPLVYGLFPLVVLIVLYVSSVFSLSKQDERFPVFAILLISAFYLLMETYPLYPITCFSALLLSAAFDGGVSATREPLAAY